MLVTLLALVVFFIYIAVRSGSPSMTLLYGDLSISDATEIATQLDIVRIPYRLESGGGEVMVPHQHVGRARMLLAQEGLPATGTIGYEVFDQKQRFGTTSFVQNINQLRAMEGELARTIRALDNVRAARVHLVLPQRELFSRESQSASASVVLSLRSNAQMESEQVLAVQHLVAAAVPGLKAENVAITDGRANLLSGRMHARTGLGGVRGGTAEDIRLQYEQRLTASVEELVSRIVGYGRVSANIVADIDFDMVTRNSEVFDPDGQVVRSAQSIVEEENNMTGGGRQAVTVETNLPGLQDFGQGDGQVGGHTHSRTEDITNFEISRTVESVVREGGEVRKLSVAVLVDGHYEAVPQEGGQDVERRYVPRTQEELDKIAALVRSAVGFDETRGDVVEIINMPFAYQIDFDEVETEALIFGIFEKQELLRLAEIMMLSLVALLVVFVVLRPLVNHIAVAAQSSAERKTAAVGSEGRTMPSLSGDAAAQAGYAGDESAESGVLDMANVEGRVNASSMRKVSDIVETHPSETVSVIRNWMSQEG